MDKRQHKRVTLKHQGWHAELIDQVSGDALGEIVNLSPGGLMLITPKEVEIESLYQVECVTHGPGGKGGRFTAGVVALWTSEASQPDTYWAGFQIIDIDAESRAQLMAHRKAMVDG